MSKPEVEELAKTPSGVKLVGTPDVFKTIGFSIGFHDALRGTDIHDQLSGQYAWL